MRICDRCKDYIISSHGDPWEVFGFSDDVHLCVACQKLFADWIEKGDKK